MCTLALFSHAGSHISCACIHVYTGAETAPLHSAARWSVATLYTHKMSWLATYSII